MDPLAERVTRIQELAVAARTLAAQIEVVDQGIRASNTPHRSAGFRLDTTASYVRSVAAQLEVTARDLACVDQHGEHTCQARWGVCPEHGDTLCSSDGRCWCRACRRTFDYHRSGLACDQPAAYLLRDGFGDPSVLCEAHATVAGERLAGAQLTPLDRVSRRGARL